MSFYDHLTTAHVQTFFTDEIEEAGGTVTDAFDDGDRLFVRSVLPPVAEVRPGDQVQGGVALRAEGGEVWVHPYVFRQVCRNGAIVAHAVQTRHVAYLASLPDEDAEEAIREAVRTCCSAEAFITATGEIRASVGAEIDTVLTLMPFLSRLRGQDTQRMLQGIFERFFRDGDRSRFGLMNAVTSLARDTRDPETRWHLEELGGGIPALRLPRLSPDAAGETVREMVGAGSAHWVG